ncbi:MAG: class I SAM-dependent methyltransferase [Calditrichaeota bacterium]|nr:class I SAM-dependent methyltransferase [Calditrichota bacterium]
MSKIISNPKEIVRTGYDKVSIAYQSDEILQDEKKYRQYREWIDGGIAQLPHGGKALDLGCGCGVPGTQFLSDHFTTTGVDISPVQIERAKKLVPMADFECADITELNYTESSFDAIVSLYTIIHVPIEEHFALLQNIHRWLKPGGYLLLIAGSENETVIIEDWFEVKGGTMYWSHSDRDTYRKWLTELRFELIWDRYIPEGDHGHPLFLGRKNN